MQSVKFTIPLQTPPSLPPSMSAALAFDVWRRAPWRTDDKNMIRYTDATEQVVEMKLTQGRTTTFDVSDTAVVSDHTWCVNASKNLEYARSNLIMSTGKQRTIKL